MQPQLIGPYRVVYYNVRWGPFFRLHEERVKVK
jgi:hypothetical protein